MSEINANIVVSPYDVNITLESPTVEVVAEPINLLLSLGGFSGAGGNVTELQYNQVGGVLGGIPFANYANGNLTLGNVANVKILGGTNQYFLQTDGTGNLTWQAGTGNATGNGTVGGANTQIQFNDSANFGGAAGFTFDKVSNAFNSPGDGTFVGNVTANNFIGNFFGNTSQLVNGNSNVVVEANANITISSNGNSNVVVVTSNSLFVKPITNANTGNLLFYNSTTGEISYDLFTGNANFANFAGNVTINAQPNITSLGTLTNLTVTGNVSGGNANLGNLIIGNFLQGTLTTAAQPNITSVGNLSVANVTGNLRAGNANLGNLASANFFSGNGYLLTGVIAAGGGSNFANYAGNITVNAQPNITSLANALTQFNVFSNTSNIAIIANNSNLIGSASLVLQNDNTQSYTALSSSPNGFISIYGNGNMNVQSAGDLFIATTSTANSNITGQLNGQINVYTGNTSSTRSYMLLVPGSNGRIAFSTQGVIELFGNSIFGNLNFPNNSSNFEHSIRIHQTSNTSNTIPNPANGSIVWKTNDPKTIQIYGTSYETPNGGWNNVVLQNKVVVANLPNANIGSGFRAFVTDANTTTFNAIVGGSGSNNIPVFSDGTDWRVG